MASESNPIDFPVPAEPSSVPDAAAPPPRAELLADLVLGGEASVPAGDYGPPIPSRFPDLARRQLEVRDLERRFRERLTPLVAPNPRTSRRFRGLARWYRGFASRRRDTAVDEFGMAPSVRARRRRLFELLYRRYFRVEVEGIDNVPDRGPVVLVANRSGVLPFDVVMLIEALRLDHPSSRELRPLVEDAVYHLPFLGVALSRVGAVRACQENADRLLERSQAVAVFPEGAQGSSKLFGDRYRLRRFGRGGFVKLAARNRATMIPVGIVGAEESMPLLGKSEHAGRAIGLPLVPVTPTFPLLGPLGLVPLPSRWRIHFGAPVEADVDPADRRAVVDVAGRVRSDIEGLIAAALRARGRAF